MNRHTLRNIDKENKTAICAVCGEVKVSYRKDRNLFRCSQKRKLENEKYSKPNKYKYPRLGYKQGLTTKQYLEEKQKFLDLQNNCCAICNNPLGDRAALDHCHETMKIRGLLCLQCNVGLGSFKDNTEVLTKAIEYLNK